MAGIRRVTSAEAPAGVMLIWRRDHVVAGIAGVARVAEEPFRQRKLFRAAAAGSVVDPGRGPGGVIA